MYAVLNGGAILFQAHIGSLFRYLAKLICTDTGSVVPPRSSVAKDVPMDAIRSKRRKPYLL